MGILHNGSEVNASYLEVARWNKYATEYGDEYGVSPALVLGDIQEESGGHRYLTSPTGAQGLMQLEPSTARSLGVSNSFNPQQNIKGGTKYLSQLYKRFGNWTDALAAYNAGPGNYKAGLGYAENVLANSSKFGHVSGSIQPPSGSSSSSATQGNHFPYPSAGTNWQDFLIHLNEMETFDNLSWNVGKDMGHILEWSVVKIGFVFLALLLVIGGFILFQPKLVGGLLE